MSVSSLSHPASTQKFCRHCKSEEKEETGALKTCSACRAVHYCSTKCQQADWSLHNSLCKKVKKLTIPMYNSSDKTYFEKTIRYVPMALYSNYFGEKAQSKFPCLSKHQIINLRTIPLPNPHLNMQGRLMQPVEFIKEYNGENYFLLEKHFDHSQFLVENCLFQDAILLNQSLFKLIRHPTLYLEMGEMYAAQARGLKNKSRIQFNEFSVLSAVFRDIAFALLAADLDSIENDPTCVGVRNAYLDKYRKKKQLDRQQQIKYPSILKREIANLCEHLELVPSPLWLAFRGKAVERGILPEIKTPEQCNKIRKQKLEELLTNIEQKASSSHK